MWWYSSGMNIPEFIELSSDEETEVRDVKDVKPILLLYTPQEKTSHGTTVDQTKSGEHISRHELEETRTPELVNGVPYGSCITDQAYLDANGSCPTLDPPSYSVSLCRQFWKSGDYEIGQAPRPVSRNGQNRLRIHPKFLHSNATSHKWAFGAIAELMDNAVDEVQKGASFVIVDKFTNPRNGDPALLVQDDGGGMDPESLRRCMSFGFSDKHSDSSIGQYGNGFKTSTMRLGADVIVFTRCIKKRVLTQSVGLLSYTFLRQTGSDDIVVPVVDYEFNSQTGAFCKLILNDEKQFSSNLLTLLKWSPFGTEVELLKQFNDIGHHGTKIIVFNLWFTDDGDMELDFKSDPKDILINGALKKVPKNRYEHDQSRKNVAYCLHYSLRAYSSVLYLHLPENFKIILRGQFVEPHHIVKDIIYPECIKYRPQVGGIAEAEVITTIGYLDGSPHVNIHGFNVYHRNRLILPFLRVANNSYGKGRGVVGVLEANFIKPTHDKQDFEKSIVFQKLETRLKEMTYEYWDFHCHLVGYTKSKNPSAMVPAVSSSQVPDLSRLSGFKSVTGASQVSRATPSPACLSAGSRGKSNSNVNSQTDARHKTGLLQKRKRDSYSAAVEPLEKQIVATGNSDESGSNHTALPEGILGQKQSNKVITMINENKKLREQCLEYEESEKKLLVKAERLQNELLEAQRAFKNLLIELRSVDDVKVEKL